MLKPSLYFAITQTHQVIAYFYKSKNSSNHYVRT